MKFLLNMNLPPSLGTRLAAASHECRHASALGLSRAEDADIIEVARANGEVILTHDLDYGHLLAFSGAPSPSVVIFRPRNTHVERLLALMMRPWTEIEQPLQEGAIVVFEDAALRIRSLPITRQSRK